MTRTPGVDRAVPTSAVVIPRWRYQVAFWSPALLYGSYWTLFGSGPLIGRGLHFLVGALLQVGFVMFFYAFALLLASLVRGEHGELRPPYFDFTAAPALAGLLLAMGLFVWRQVDERRTVEAIATCVEDYLSEGSEDTPSALVRWCYEQLGENEDAEPPEY